MTGPRRVAALDGLRGLAVAAVLLFHGGVAALPGGFLGVDAFFVLSGFLITTLLLGEHARSGRIDLAGFWARRARRLLPALLLMLMTVLVAARWLVPPEELGRLRGDALATAGYLANWRMTERGGGYFAQTAPPSPLQHTWSLAIEEQFYLLWPLLLAPLLALSGRRWGRGLLTALCVAGAGASVAAGALLAGQVDGDRLYYGTDTRILALLIGCALAAVLAGRPARRTTDAMPAASTASGSTASRSTAAGRAAADNRPRGLLDAGAPAGGRHRILGLLALLGAGTTAWLWTHAEGSSPWLYRGGLAVAALAVAAVIAHAVRSPRSPTARLLSLPPLAALGVISYGVYLWHWPLFQWLDGERTGLAGPRLLALRCAATLAVATVSYLAVERPLRTARWTRRPLRAYAAAGTAMAATAAAAVVLTVPPPAPAPPPPAAVDQAVGRVLAEPRVTRSAEPAPVHRPGRKPGKLPRIDFFGDSVSWSLGTYLPEQSKLAIKVRSVQGCGIARLPDIRYIGSPHTNYPGCATWDRRWRRGISRDDPDVAVVLLDRWELMDRRLDGRYQHIGDPAFDAYLTRELDLAIDIVSARGARVVLLTAPYTRRAERPDGGLWPEDRPERVDAWNAMLRAAADRHGAAMIDLNRRVCPDGRFTWRAGGVQVRSDGLHFTTRGVREHIAPWLLPQLAAAAVRPPSATG